MEAVVATDIFTITTTTSPDSRSGFPAERERPPVPYYPVGRSPVKRRTLIGKTASPLSYILQAAMGQCSTLPAEGSRPSSSVSSRLESLQARDPIYAEQRHRLRDERGRESLDFNKLVPNQQNFDPEISKEEAKAAAQLSKLVKDGPKSDIGMVPVPTESTTPPRQSRDLDAMRAAADSPVPMDTEQRDEMPSIFHEPPPPPPENAVRTRCYKLNLDSEIVGLSSSQKQGICLGPFSEPPPYLTYSSSEDSEKDITPTDVAIKTAQIFRGITVGRDGTILSQNARATRSNRGKGTKRGEKSRQAAKIDKAKDLVEETIASGKAPDSDDPASMVSLIVVGEYDDMKHLVRDGSKKLRDAVGLPDSHLTSINQLRVAENPSSSTAISPRKRVSPSLVHSQRNAALQSPEKIQATGPSTSQTAPPKLKSNPRDTRPGRRENAKMRLDSCNDFIDPRRPGGAVDGDWSHAWNIWNCGGVGAVSPFQPSSPTDRSVFEGREASHNTNREGAVTTRAD